MGNSFSSQDHLPFGRLPGRGHFWPGIYYTYRFFSIRNKIILTSDIVKVFASLFSSFPFQAIGIVATFLVGSHSASMFVIGAIFEIA